MSHTTFQLFFTLSLLYTASTEFSCDSKITYHLIRHAESYYCLCNNKLWQSTTPLQEICSNPANNASWRTLCGVETNRILDCPPPLSEPSGAAIPATSTTRSTVSGGGKFTVYNLQTEENNSLVRFLTGLMEHLQPNELPLGLIKDLYVLGMPLQLASFQILKLEAFGLFWIFIWLVLALFLPLSLITHFCCAPKHAFFDTSSETSNTTNKNVLKATFRIFINFLLLSSLATTLILLLYNNQQISQTIGKSTTTTKLLMDNLASFINESKTQAISVTIGATEEAITAINQDLDNVEDLLGAPYQQRLTTATGIDVALTALSELQKAVTVMSTQTSDLLKACETARKIRAELQEELRDVSGQVLMMRYQCSVRDRRLCETLQPIGFNVVFAVRNITENQQLRNLSQGANFNTTGFQRIPKGIAAQTLSTRADIKGALEKRRRQISESVVELEDIGRNLTVSVRGWCDGIEGVLKVMVEYDFRRWLLTIVAVLAIFTTLIFFICGGCGSNFQKTFCLCFGLASSSVTCIIIWLLASFYFLIGGHSCGFLCKPLNDHPEYTTIGKLVDADGLFFNGVGLWRHLLHRNITVGFAGFLGSCEKNDSIFDVLDIEIPEKTPANVNDLIAKINFDPHAEILTPALEQQLQELSSILSVNLTNQRLALAKPITGRDLNSFLDQINLIAKRLSDRSSIKRLEDLRHTIKSVVDGKLEALTKLRDEIAFNVTKLEVLFLPLKAELEQTLSHLKSIENYLENHTERLAAEVAENYKAKLKEHLQNFPINFKRAGNCHPLWKIFDVLRYNICDLFTEPMNCLAFCCFFCILLFLLIAPTTVISMQSSGVEMQTPSMTRRLLADHQREVWTTPVDYDSPEICQEIPIESIPHHETVAPLPPPPPPPHPPSIPFIEEPQRLSPPRIKTTKYRARTPRGRFESLRQVQPISWKTSISPVRWI